MYKPVRFCTAQRTLFVDMSHVVIKGLYQLCVKRYGTLYRVKRHEDGFVAHLDKSVNGKRWAVLAVDAGVLHPDRYDSREQLLESFPLADAQAAINVR